MIGEVEHKICPWCQEWLPLSNYYKSQSQCKECQNSRVRKQAGDTKRKAIKYKGGECLDCKNQFPDYIYDFHHRNPSKKDFKLSFQKVRRMDWKLVTKELDKCDLLCVHCHRDRHYNKDNPNYCPSR